MISINCSKPQKVSVLLPVNILSILIPHCYSIVELETSWEKETGIHVELGNFIFFPIWFRIVLYINRLFVINEKTQFFLQLSLITWYQSKILNLP